MIGIITFSWSRNYGAVLQTFALKHFLEKNGYEVHVINYQPIATKKKESINNFIKGILLDFLLITDKKKIQEQIDRFDKFRKDYFNFTEKISFPDEDCGTKFDVIICGSDQIWNPKLTGGSLNKIYFGYLKNNEKAKKIAYAASIGEKKIDNTHIKLFEEYLNNLNYISVREEQIVSQIQNLTDKKVYHTVDPTLLLRTEDYVKIARRSSMKKIDRPYILIYQNTKNEDIYKIAKRVSQLKNLDIVEIGYRRQFPKTGIPIIENAGPQEFLGVYLDAEFVVTNTFHGTVFAIQSKKKYISIPLKERESRVENLAKLLGLENRLVYSYSEDTIDSLVNEEIDYLLIDEKLSELSRQSAKFLNDSISMEKR